VLRSSLLLDEDLATRSAGLGRLHRELGFEQLARLRGWDAVAANPTDYAGHRLLADVYSTSPRHELARVSELLVSQLLQPASLSPVPPQLAQPTSFIAGRAGPSDLAFTELAPLVAENGLKLQASSVVADHGTYGEDVALAGLHDRLSYNVGHYRFATDGFRPNNDLDETVANAFVQFRPTAATSLQAEIRSVESTEGDLTLRFDPAVYGTDYRQHDSVNSLRLGMRHDVSTRSTFLASVIAQDHDADAGSRAGGFKLHSTADGTSSELQNILLGRRWNLRSGFSYLRQNRTDARTFEEPYPLPSEANSDSTTREASLYAYAQLAALPHLDVTIGASADRLDGFSIAANQINPKVGIAWNAGRFTVRAAAFRTLEGSSTTSLESPQPRLEPVQVAGFNQFFFGSIGDEALTRGLAIDGSVSATLAAGAELSARTRHVPVFANLASSIPIPQTIRERSGGAYLYWTPAEKIAVSVRYDVDRVGSEPPETTDATALRTRRLPMELRYFGENGWTVRARVTAVDQRGVFASHAGGFLPGHDQFLVVDTSLGFRLPKRRGLLSLNVDNLFDERFRFQELDFATPTLMPARMAYFRFTLAFD
jgi:hypothetical protein